MRLQYPYQRKDSLSDLCLNIHWNLPKKSGHEVLKEIKGNCSLKSTSVIVLTTSSAEKDILKAYDLHANAYIVKPINFDEFMKAIRFVEDFWLKAVTSPPKKDQKLD